MTKKIFLQTFYHNFKLINFLLSIDIGQFFYNQPKCTRIHITIPISNNLK